jgi:AcrR family transcriptional regulator
VRTQRFRREVADQNKRSRTRALLMDAAVTVFAKRGVEKTPISDITATAKVSNGTFYYHFKDKAELIDEVGHAIAAALVNQVDDAIRPVVDGAERVAFASQHFIRLASAEPEWGWLVVEALSDMGSFHDQISRGIRKDVGIGMEQRKFSVQPSDLLFTSLLAVVGIALRTRLENPDSPDIERSAAEMVLRMLGVSDRWARELPEKVIIKYSAQHNGTINATGKPALKAG